MELAAVRHVHEVLFPQNKHHGCLPETMKPWGPSAYMIGGEIIEFVCGVKPIGAHLQAPIEEVVQQPERSSI